MKTLGGIVVVLIIIAGFGYFAMQNEQGDTNEVEEVEMMDNEEAVMGDEGMESEGASSDEELPQAQAGSYLAYSADAVANSDADKIVLFFHASWCPTCRALDRDITSNLEDIPAGVEIYKVDYDRETALKQQYGITRQHSVISIGADGEAVVSVFHPNSLSALISGVW